MINVKVTLFDRLKCEGPLGYDGLWFEYKKQKYKTIKSLIQIVTDRYSRLYGFLSYSEAQKIHTRLAEQYSSCPNAIIHRFEDDGKYYGYKFMFLYPKAFCVTWHKQTWDALIEADKNKTPYTPANEFKKLRDEHESLQKQKQLKEFMRIQNRICEDNSNLNQCRKLLNQLKGIVNESTKNNRATS